MKKFTYEKSVLNNQNGVKIRLLEESQRLSFDRFFSLLRKKSLLSVYFSKLIIETGYQSAFLEFPPISKNDLQNDVEFVLIEAPALNSVRANPSSFSTYFDQSEDGSTVVDFMNLGNDTILISPKPNGKSYGHLVTFLRSATEKEIVSLWSRVAKKFNDQLGKKPIWLSTSGLGVPWLHIRISNTPKYYTHQSYTVALSK